MIHIYRLIHRKTQKKMWLINTIHSKNISRANWRSCASARVAKRQRRRRWIRSTKRCRSSNRYCWWTNNIYSSKQHLFIKTTSIQPDSMHSSSFSFILLSKWQHSRHFEMTTCCHSCAVVQCEQCGQRIRHFSVANVWRPLCHTQNATVGHQCERNVFA